MSKFQFVRLPAVATLIAALIQCVPTPAAAADPWQNTGRGSQPKGTEAIPGRISYWRTGKISSRIPGQIETLPVRVGDRVKKGDVLATLNTERLRADLAVAE